MKLTALYLASQSPRRSELLSQIGLEFKPCNVDVLEQQQCGEQAREYVTRLAQDKARAGVIAVIRNQLEVTPFMVLGADTIVVYAGQILEKPADEADAVRMLSLLSGHQHQVMTAVALADNERCMVDLVVTDVTFRTLSQTEIREYWRTGEPADKAGSYAIQGLAGRFISHISGSYSAVVGLPLMQTEQLIQAFKAEQNK